MQLHGIWKTDKIRRSREIAKTTAARIHESMIQLVLVCGSERWTVRMQDEIRIFTTGTIWLQKLTALCVATTK